MKNLIVFVFLLFCCAVCYGQKQLGVQNIGVLPAVVTATSDNFQIDVSGRTYFRIGSNSNSAVQRTILLNRGTIEGQLLYIEFVGANTAEFVDDSTLTGGGNLRISGNFSMTSFDILVLLWNGTDWVQVVRSVN